MSAKANSAANGKWGCLVWVAILAGIGTLGWFVASRLGYVPHDHETPVWIEGSWLEGEERECDMRTKTVPPNHAEMDSLEKLPRLFCGVDSNGLFEFQSTIESSGHDLAAPPPGQMAFIGVTSSDLDRYFQVMPVRYFGSTDRTDKWVISWRCVRRSQSLECKALD